jgi:hypothetical protein
MTDDRDPRGVDSTGGGEDVERAPEIDDLGDHGLPVVLRIARALVPGEALLGQERDDSLVGECSRVREELRAVRRVRGRVVPVQEEGRGTCRPADRANEIGGDGAARSGEDHVIHLRASPLLRLPHPQVKRGLGVVRELLGSDRARLGRARLRRLRSGRRRGDGTPRPAAAPGEQEEHGREGNDPAEHVSIFRP